MGVIKTQFGFWSDSGQDLVDDFLQNYHAEEHLIEFKSRTQAEQKKLRPVMLRAYRAVLNDKKLREKFNAVHLEATGKMASANEFKHHVATGLGLTHTGLFGGRPKLPALRRRPEVRVRRHARRMN